MSVDGEAHRVDCMQARGLLPRFITMVAAILGLVLCFVAPSPVLARAEGDWVGKRVIPKSPVFRLQVQSQLIDPKSIGFYRVEQIKGSWLWLRLEGWNIRGWAKADAVVPEDEGIDFFTRQIESNPQDPAPHVMRAILLRERREFDKALLDLDEVIRTHPSFAEYQQSRGVLWLEKNEYDQAIASFSYAIQLKPNLAMAYYNRGLSWHAKGEDDRAIADFSYATDLDPGHSLAYSSRALSWLAKKDHARAIADLDQALILNPEDVKSLYDRGFGPVRNQGI